jgi:hypothetical protein
MQCPFCKAFIDDDSIYCDQCGKEIFICPKCNKPGKGKMCIHDGTPLISMKEKIGSIHTDVKTSGTVSSANKKASEKSELCLINKNLGLNIKIEKDVLIGRETGDYVDIFGQYQRISGKHLKINFDVQKGWLATDLGSTNGTKYNNVPLVPNQPQALGDNSSLIIATIEFYIQINNKNLAGKTGTKRV